MWIICFYKNHKKITMPNFKIEHKLKTVIKTISSKPKNIFLIDSIGAFLSANLLFIIISFLDHEFGISDERFSLLFVLSCVFSIYSICCYFLIDKKWQLFLRIIAVANLLYCLLTVLFLLNLYNNITLSGLIYFICEIIIIISLAVVEWQTAKKNI